MWGVAPFAQGYEPVPRALASALCAGLMGVNTGPGCSDEALRRHGHTIDAALRVRGANTPLHVMQCLVSEWLCVWVALGTDVIGFGDILQRVRVKAPDGTLVTAIKTLRTAADITKWLTGGKRTRTPLCTPQALFGFCADWIGTVLPLYSTFRGRTCAFDVEIARHLDTIADIRVAHNLSNLITMGSILATRDPKTFVGIVDAWGLGPNTLAVFEIAKGPSEACAVRPFAASIPLGAPVAMETNTSWHAFQPVPDPAMVTSTWSPLTPNTQCAIVLQHPTHILPFWCAWPLFKVLVAEQTPPLLPTVIRAALQTMVDSSDESKHRSIQEAGMLLFFQIPDLVTDIMNEIVALPPCDQTAPKSVLSIYESDDDDQPAPQPEPKLASPEPEVGMEVDEGPQFQASRYVFIAPGMAEYVMRHMEPILEVMQSNRVVRFPSDGAAKCVQKTKVHPEDLMAFDLTGSGPLWALFFLTEDVYAIALAGKEARRAFRALCKLSLPGDPVGFRGPSCNAESYAATKAALLETSSWPSNVVQDGVALYLLVGPSNIKKARQALTVLWEGIDAADVGVVQLGNSSGTVTEHWVSNRPNSAGERILCSRLNIETGGVLQHPQDKPGLGRVHKVVTFDNVRAWDGGGQEAVLLPGPMVALITCTQLFTRARDALVKLAGDAADELATINDVTMDTIRKEDAEFILAQTKMHM